MRRDVARLSDVTGHYRAMWAMLRSLDFIQKTMESLLGPSSLGGPSIIRPMRLVLLFGRISPTWN